jgi:tRNA pseudouridine55 synthase
MQKSPPESPKADSSGEPESVQRWPVGTKRQADFSQSSLQSFAPLPDPSWQSGHPEQAAKRDKQKKRNVHGWVALDKPIGMTSTHAVAVIRRLFTARRAGHAGTLDPLASGCLPIALGEATKTVPFVVGARKTYLFTVRWGEERDTDDAEGRVVNTSESRPDRAAIQAVLPRHIGTIEQVPPRFSAVKIDGERAYDLAREGERVELAPRAVTIYRLDLIDMPDTDHAVFAADCGKGTYVRALARDLGRALGVLGHICALRRRQVGPFGENDMISLERLESLCHRAAAGEGTLAATLLPIETALDDIPALAVSSADAARLQRGQAALLRGRDAAIVRGTVQVAAGGQLVAIAEVDRGEIVPKRVFNLTGVTGRADRRKGW